MTNIFGYFDDAAQATPAYDPGMDALCPVCVCPLKNPVVTTSLLKMGDSRSYFFRTHKSCWNACSLEEQSKIEHSLIDSL